jgi:hypothetical protein
LALCVHIEVVVLDLVVEVEALTLQIHTYHAIFSVILNSISFPRDSVFLKFS